jgi:hypothetical protein
MQGSKTGGRKKGIPNKITARLRSELSEHLETYIENQFSQDWIELTARERVRVALSISQLLVPKPTPEPTEEEVEANKKPDQFIITIKEPCKVCNPQIDK